MKITIEQSQTHHLFKEVYVDGKFQGSVMADDTRTASECYQMLQQDCSIDQLEYLEDAQIQNSLNY